MPAASSNIVGWLSQVRCVPADEEAGFASLHSSLVFSRSKDVEPNEQEHAGGGGEVKAPCKRCVKAGVGLSSAMSSRIRDEDET